jgi:hypothetical protein
MDVYANGTEQKAPALTLALALPGMLTTWLLAQPDVLGTALDDGAPLAALGDLGQTLAVKSLTFDASASYDPSGPAGGGLSYAWDFGDGATASGATVNHTYAQPGTYTVRLTVGGRNGARHLSQTLTVSEAPTFQMPPFPYRPSGSPPANPQVTLPQPDAAPAPTTPAVPGTISRGFPWLPIGLALLAVVVALLVFVMRRRAAFSAGGSAAGRFQENDGARRRRRDALDTLLRGGDEPPL